MKPVFIVGCVRSGTTILRLMLNQSPWVDMIGEFEYGYMWGRQDDMAKYRQLLGRDRAYLKAEHKTTIPDFADHTRVVRELFRELASQDKIPGASVHNNFHLLPEAFPLAKFIHIVRDPRDVANSIVRMGWSGNAWHASKKWNKAINNWHKLTYQVGRDQCLEIRYEDLVKNPDIVLGKVCYFLGIPYAKDLLNYHENSSYGPLDPKFTYQWENNLNLKDISETEDNCHRAMRKYDYRPIIGSLEPTPAEKLVLHLEHKKNRILFNVRKYGLKNYLLWQIARKTNCFPKAIEEVNKIDESLLK